MVKTKLKKRLKSQADILKVEPLATSSFTTVFKVQQKQPSMNQTQIVRCCSRFNKPFYWQRETKLLEYLNQFPDFIHLNQTRKIAKHLVQFFDYHGDFNLQHHVQNVGPLDTTACTLLLTNMVSSLEKLQQQRWVHGDINPSNIIVTEHRFYLIDFSKATYDQPSFESEQMVGDDRYCPPERLNGVYDIKGDLYALGQTLFYALTGRHIFELTGGESEWEKLYANAFFQPQNLHLLSEDWQTLIVWMTQKEPQKRPSLNDLKQWVIDQSKPNWLQPFEIEKTIHEGLNNRFATHCLQALRDANYEYANFCYAIDIKPSDPETAYQIFKQGALRGYSRSNNNMALMHEEGVFVKQSWEIARKLYAQALKKQNPFAAFNIGLIYQHGLGVPKDDVLAFKLFTFAAERGNASAQVELAETYLKGRTPSPIKKPKKQAKIWLKRAAKMNNHHAIQRLAELKESNLAQDLDQ